MSGSVGLVVNCYERTYRDVLRPGFFSRIEDSVLRPLDERVALINNVESRSDAEERARSLLALGEITSFAFVADHLVTALKSARLPRRSLGDHPYFLDYGLVMPHVVGTEWLLGWDAEVLLEQPVNWIDPSIALMRSDSRIFSASVNWPQRGSLEGTLPGETVERSGDFWLNWGFSDQLFLVSRGAMAAPIFRKVAPASWIRNIAHPGSFESRVEAYQRTRRLFRATYEPIRYKHNDLELVLNRVGWTTRDRLQQRVLHILGAVIQHLPIASPRFKAV